VPIDTSRGGITGHTIIVSSAKGQESLLVHPPSNEQDVTKAHRHPLTTLSMVNDYRQATMKGSPRSS
jgi:hypothetical protein